MSINIRNLTYLRDAKPTDTGYSQRLYEALSDLLQAHVNHAQQTNSDLSGQPSPPPQVNQVQVSEQGGYAHVSITDHNEVYRGIRYYVEHADNPAFQNPQVEYLGDARQKTVPVGNQTRYFRAYSAYSPTAPSAPQYHGGAQPTAVRGTGTTAGPKWLPSQGSGTGTPGQGLSGPGPVPYRTKTGGPPVRSANARTGK